MFHDVTPVNITPDTSNEPCMFLIWPVTVVHVIDEESPFYKMSAPEMANDQVRMGSITHEKKKNVFVAEVKLFCFQFELHVVLEGSVEATSMTFQARTSYLPNEIYWGHRFEPMMIYRKDHNKYQVIN